MRCSSALRAAAVVLAALSVTCDRFPGPGTESNRANPLVGPNAVRWWWWTNDEDQEPALLSPVILDHGSGEVLYTSAAYPNRLYGIDVETGHVVWTGEPVAVTEENTFTGHPAYCEATGHIIVGGEDGELYAFNPTANPNCIWHWPGYTDPDSLTYIEWGTPAVHGDRIYVPRDDDFLYLLRDRGASVTCEASCYVMGIGEAVVIDANGYPYVVDDLGHLTKLKPGLNGEEWNAELSPGCELYTPSIGDDGAVYVGSANGTLYKVDPATGQPTWESNLFSGEVYRCVVGCSSIFVTTELGVLLSVRPSDGGINWWTALSFGELVTSPVLTGNGLLYVQDIDDIVYCLRQEDGTLRWPCNCLDWGPIFRTRAGRETRRGRDFFISEGSPAISRNGRLIVVGEEALYCLAGYADVSLADAPWPKWQGNIYNTGTARHSIPPAR